MADLMDTWGVDESSQAYRPIDDGFVEALNFKEAALQQVAPDGVPHDPSNQQKPIFSVEQVEYRVAKLKQMVVCSNWIALAMENSGVQRLNLERPEEVENIDVGRDPIHKIFMDPGGRFLLISVLGSHPEVYFLHSSWKKPRLMMRLRGLVLNSVAWDRSIPEHAATTGEILLGTTNGLICHTIIDIREGKERTFKQVYNMNDDTPVTGLRYERFPNDPPRFFVMATTATRIYQFVGPAPLETVFDNYLQNPGFQELPSPIPYSELCFFSPHGGLPIHFAWLTGVGLFHGNLTFGSQGIGDNVGTDTTLYQYPQPKHAAQKQGLPKAPISVAMTEFHFLLVFEDRFMAICRLNEQIICDLDLPKRLGKPRGLAHDVLKKTVWLYFEGAIFEVIIDNEDRNAWELYLGLGQFDMAKKYAKENWQRDKIFSAQADRYFNEKKYDLAAQFYGQTQKSFEEVALKFVQMNERDALKTFLQYKLKKLSPEDKTQMTIICTWLVEIFLNKLNLLFDRGERVGYENCSEEFKTFLDEHKDHLDKATTFHLITSHGRIHELLQYANLINDHERVVSYLIQHKKYVEALEVMNSHPSENIFYKFTPILMTKIPFQMVNVLLATLAGGVQLVPKKLLPALMKYKPSRIEGNVPPEARENQAIRYLRVVVQRDREPAVHNFLLSLYAEQLSEDDLIAFLTAPNPVYDLDYALRLATKYNKTRACILIYSAMGLYEEAVDLALKVDIEEAKRNADMPKDYDEGLRKKLWLKIARHVVEEEKDIKKAMEFLSQCELLKIEDILPFFPDFVYIDDFKQEICKSLDEYNKHIEELKREMDKATENADTIRRDIKNIKNKYGFIREDKKCDLCGYLVLTKQFYLFPCKHVFHADCLYKEMMNHMSAANKSRMQYLRDKINAKEATPNQGAKSQWSLLQSLAIGSDESAPASVPQMNIDDQLKSELDELCASDCIYCSDIMIRSITEPFTDGESDPEYRSWLI